MPKPAYISLPPILQRLSVEAPPSRVSKPRLVVSNETLAAELGLEPGWVGTDDAAEFFSGHLGDDHPAPRAFAYAGHQFGGLVPLLGDGRATLLGEVHHSSGTPRQIQLKGSGRTPFSRGGSDGRAWLGPILREYVVSEAMHALGISTTRALAAVSTGEFVRREQSFPGAVLTRVSQGLLRVGTFEFLYHRQDEEGLRELVSHALSRHFPEVEPGDTPALTLLDQVSHRQSRLISQWLSVGFIHGVMNTDNCSIPGETLDYGPCAFLDNYHPHTKFSSIDHAGRYAYANQPRVAHWNLAALAQALVPLLPDLDSARAAIEAFPDRFAAQHAMRMREKLGLKLERPDDDTLAADFLSILAEQEADFTRTFRALGRMGQEPGPADTDLSAELADPNALDEWLARWRKRLTHEPAQDEGRHTQMQSVNPAVIPRNHRIEEMIQSAVSGDMGPLHTLCSALATPFEVADAHLHLTEAPKPEERVCLTFCGT